MTGDEERTAWSPQPPSTGNLIAGLFLSCFGIFMTLLGGGCTVLTISFFSSEYGGGDSGSMVMLVLLSLGILGGGIFALYHGVRMLRGRPPG